ncbi:MAG: MBL fold metallo-hydrolase [Pseudoramibacter sp.]
MKKINDQLYQFSIYIPPMDFTIHQYLLNTDPAILFAAGTVRQAEAILPDLKAVLGDKPLRCVFVSHMESDEAGGVSVLKREWPDLTVVTSGLAARELPGYGYKGDILVKRGGDTLEDGDLNLTFVDYPAEVHLQNGLLAYEQNTGIFYSADLFLRFGNGVGKTVDANWADEVAAIDAARVPDDALRAKLQDTLKTLSPKFVAVGHGFCLNCR